MKYKNYSIGEILEKKNKGVNTPEMTALYKKVEKYKAVMERRVSECIKTINLVKPDNVMRWIQENAPLDIKKYVYCIVQGKEANVLMRSEKKWKTVADIGLDIDEPGSSQEHIDEWFDYWNEQAEMLAALNINVYESHAHYNLRNYNALRNRLLPMLHKAGIKQIVIPAVDFPTNSQIVKMFDTPEYDYIKYVFGIHPKYIWKETLSDKNWDSLINLYDNPKCVAIGETGLDYSYPEFDDSHRSMQMELFRKFILLANQYCLPAVLHIRSSDDIMSNYKADEDAWRILEENKIQCGAVLHCFGGSISDVEKYMSVGVKKFGIGGRILYGNEALEKAVAYLPEMSILLETDSPYIKVDRGQIPNTSLSLLPIARKVAELRDTTAEHILEVSFKNAEKFFQKDRE